MIHMVNFNGMIIEIIEIASILIVVLAVVISFFYRNKNKELKRRQDALRNRLEVQEKSFDTIYNEIHDNIGQTLSLAKLNLHSVESDLPDGATEKIKHSKELLSKAITDLRNLGRNLNAKPLADRSLTDPAKKN